MKQKKTLSVILAVCLVLLLAAVLVCLTVGELTRDHTAEACVKLLNDHSWTVIRQERLACTGEEFINGTPDITFSQYVTEVRGIKLQKNDALVLYSFVLGEQCLDYTFDSYILTREGKILCGAIWYSEVMNTEGMGSTIHDAYHYYPLETSERDLRRFAIQEVTNFAR